MKVEINYKEKKKKTLQNAQTHGAQTTCYWTTTGVIKGHRKKMKNYLETNEIGNIAIQKSMGHSKSSSKRKVYSNTAYLKVYSDTAHLTDVAKEVLRETFMVIEHT